MVRASPRTVASNSREQDKSKVVVQLIDLISELEDCYGGTVWDEAAKESLARLKNEIIQLQIKRVTLRTLSAVREVSAGMFTQFARRAAAARALAERSSEASTYRSAMHVTSYRYFESPFLRQLAVHRDGAMDEVFGGDAALRKSTVRMECVVIVPAKLWRDAASPEGRAGWKSIDAHLTANAGLLDVRTHLVLEEDLNSSSSLSPYLDFGLYGDVAVGVYSCTSGEEELRVEDGSSQLYAQCSQQWERFSHSSANRLEWSEVVHRLKLVDPI